MRRQRGFTLMEILIAMALTAIVTTSVLAIVRTQMVAFEMNDQIVRTQQNARAAMDFVETTVRRACGGVSAGLVGINVSGVTPAQVPCLRLLDGATVSTAFSAGSAGSPDVLEVIYATGTMTALTGPPSPSVTLTTSSTFAVASTAGFAVGDLVLVGNYSYADLFRVQAVPSATSLVFDAQATTAGTPTAILSVPVGSPVFKAASYSFYVAPSSVSATYGNMLMIDPNGVTSTNHVDFTKVQPAVEGVVDFQVAIGVDGNADGIITENLGSPATDEWLGNSWGETAPTLLPLPWNTAPTDPQLRQVRLGLILQTLNSYPGIAAPLTPLEDHGPYTVPAAGQPSPRYRAVRMVVAPRAWNLTE